MFKSSYRMWLHGICYSSPAELTEIRRISSIFSPFTNAPLGFPMINTVRKTTRARRDKLETFSKARGKKTSGPFTDSVTGPHFYIFNQDKSVMNTASQQDLSYTLWLAIKDQRRALIFICFVYFLCVKSLQNAAQHVLAEKEILEK